MAASAALYATPTKPGRPAIGLEEIARVHAAVRIPIFCIGGIKLENLDAVIAAGARRVVIVTGLLQAPDIADYARRVKERLLATRERRRLFPEPHHSPRPRRPASATPSEGNQADWEAAFSVSLVAPLLHSRPLWRTRK